MDDYVDYVVVEGGNIIYSRTYKSLNEAVDALNRGKAIAECDNNGLEINLIIKENENG